MRRRLAALFFVLAAVVGGSVMGAAPAAAADYIPNCTLAVDNTLIKIVCSAAPADRPIYAIRWAIDDIPVANYDERRQIEFYCERGRFYKVWNGTFYQDGSDLRGARLIQCPQRVANVFAGCSSGGSRLQCSVTWEGGAPPISIRWRIDGALRTFFNDSFWLDISCRAPSTPYIEVTVTDLTGSWGYSAGYCGCHGGPLD